ncbi:MAG: hypothetical protein AAB465_02145 [Patescibacteria group bacterium]
MNMNKFESSNCPICGQPYCEHVKPATEAVAAQEQVAVEPEKTDENKIEALTSADVYEVNEQMTDQQIANQVVDTVINLYRKSEYIKLLTEYEKITPEATDKMDIRDGVKSQLVFSMGIRREKTDFNTMIKDLAYYVQRRLEESVAENKDKLTNYIKERSPEKQEV